MNSPHGTPPVELDRLRVIASQHVNAQERTTTLATAAGRYIDRPFSVLRAAFELNAGIRDGLYLLPDRLLILAVEAAPQIGFRRTLRLMMARNNKSKLESIAGEVALRDKLEFPRDTIARIYINSEPPPSWQVTGGTFLHIVTKTGGTCDFYIDVHNTDIDQLQSAVGGYPLSAT